MTTVQSAPDVDVLDRVTPARPSAPTKPSRRREPRGFRPDIEGLRAIAVVLVVLYHAHLAFPGGYVGVDVFFVISGFLITRHLVKAISRNGIRALPAFYGGRVRRLLPAAAVVVVATVVAARLWAPVLSVPGIATDAVYSTFYGLNYRLAALGTDYQHMGAAASPLQHFWSLGVEEQFYLLWPLLIVVLMVVARRRAHQVLVAVVVTVVAVSGWYSVTVTEHSAPWAYFSLHTRAWELGLGALVALTARSLTAVPQRIRGGAAVLGLAAILLAGLTYTDSTPFPGYAAWLPVGGTALVIAAGCGTRVGAERLLSEPLMQCLGRVSYSWYLWHWPMLVIIPMGLGHQLGWIERAGVVWLSLVAALLSYVLVEQPTRTLRLPSVAWLGVGAGLSAAIVAASVVVLAFPPSSTGNGAAVTLAASDSATSTVPAVMRDAIAAGTKTTQAPRNLTPRPAAAADSLPGDRGTGCHAEFTQVQQGACVFGDASAKRTVVLFGDSHMEQWLPAFVAAADRDHWRVVSWTKSACPAAAITVRNSSLQRTYTECDQWRRQTIARIGALQPDLVLVSQSETVVPGDVSPEDFAAATATTVSRIKAATDGEVAYLQDIPIPGKNLPECVASNLDAVDSCTYRAGKAYSYPHRHAAIAPAMKALSVRTIDTQPWFCTASECPPVVGNVLVYRDDSHMTVPYSTWLAPLARSVLQTTKG
ncbi:acyltransferase family protein [Angustibacter luteus]|uniref:Acyltransferase family protein n=1 Tax=Angustibacter luteus TaxID=658456 RepID=A0ABW1JDR6_9ACTN